MSTPGHLPKRELSRPVAMTTTNNYYNQIYQVNESTKYQYDPSGRFGLITPTIIIINVKFFVLQYFLLDPLSFYRERREVSGIGKFIMRPGVHRNTVVSCSSKLNHLYFHFRSMYDKKVNMLHGDLIYTGILYFNPINPRKTGVFVKNYLFRLKITKIRALLLLL